MSLMEESANAELQGRPGGARRQARSAAGHRRENLGKARGKEGDATRGPGSTSTHLNFGPSQGQCGRTIRPSLLPSSPSPRLISFLLVRASNSLCLSFSRPFSLSPCLPLRQGPYRIIASYRARTHALSRAVASAFFFFFLSCTDSTYDPAKSQLVEIPV